MSRFVTRLQALAAAEVDERLRAQNAVVSETEFHRLCELRLDWWAERIARFFTPHGDPASSGSVGLEVPPHLGVKPPAAWDVRLEALKLAYTILRDGAGATPGDSRPFVERVTEIAARLADFMVDRVEISVGK